MKTMIKKSMLVIALLVAMLTQGSNRETGVSLTVVDAKLIQLSVINYFGDVDVTVRDIYGVVLHKETLNGQQTLKRYDFGTLPLGNYNVEIETETQIESVQFKVTTSEIELIDNSDVYFKPVVHVVDELVSISKLSLNGAMMEVSIYNDQDELLYYQKVTEGPNLGVRLSFELLGAGNYRARMFADGKLFIEDFTIK